MRIIKNYLYKIIQSLKKFFSTTIKSKNYFTPTDNVEQSTFIKKPSNVLPGNYSDCNISIMKDNPESIRLGARAEPASTPKPGRRY